MPADKRSWEDFDQRRAAAALRQSEERQAFLLQLSDALRPLADTGEIEREADRMLGEHLDVAAVLFCHLLEDRAEVVNEYRNGETASFLGRYSYDDWSTPTELVRRGQSFVAGDLEAALITSEERERWSRFGFRSALSVPVLRQGAAVASLSICHTAPRVFSHWEVQFVQDIADRTWTAIERALAEENLRESEARRHLALEAAGLGTFVWHPREDRTEPDLRMLQLFGLDAASQLGLAQAVGKMLHPDDRQRYAGAVARAIDPQGDGRLAEEIRILHPDRSLHWIAVTAQTVFQPGEPAQAMLMYGIAADVTERKRREANQQFILDLDRRLGGLGKPEEIEQAAIAALGGFLGVERCYFAHIQEKEWAIVTREHRDPATQISVVARHRFADFFSPEALEQYRTHQTFAVNDVLADPRTAASAAAFAALDIRSFVTASVFYQGEWVAIVSAAGSEPRVWREDELELLRETAARVYPLMERSRAEKALRESEARLATVFTALPVGVGLVDAGGKLVLANRKMQHYLPNGIIPSRDDGPAHWRAWHPDGRPVDRHDFPGARALRGETVMPGIEMQFTGDDGTTEWKQVTAVPHRDDEGRVLGQITVVTDIDALKRARDQLHEADRRKSEFLAMLGHELRNPLAAVEGGLKLLRSPKARPESREATLPIVAQQVAHMKRLLDDLLDLARLERGKLQVQLVPVDLGATLRNALQMTENRAQAKGTEIRYRPPAAPIILNADPERLLQVFANLLANALKFSSPGSPVDVEVEAWPAEKAVVRVRDYGRGITPGDLPEIFEPFVQSKLSLGLPEGGLGLGLSVSRELVELHGGKIQAFSEGLYQGSTFVVSLPLP